MAFFHGTDKIIAILFILGMFCWFAYSDGWFNNLEKYHLEKSIGWQIAIVKKINQFSTIIETSDKTQGVIEFKNISWTKKEFDKLFRIGDIIYVEQINANKFDFARRAFVFVTVMSGSY